MDKIKFQFSKDKEEEEYIGEAEHSSKLTSFLKFAFQLVLVAIAIASLMVSIQALKASSYPSVSIQPNSTNPNKSVGLADELAIKSHFYGELKDIHITERYFMFYQVDKEQYGTKNVICASTFGSRSGGFIDKLPPLGRRSFRINNATSGLASLKEVQEANAKKFNEEEEIYAMPLLLLSVDYKKAITGKEYRHSESYEVYFSDNKIKKNNIDELIQEGARNILPIKDPYFVKLGSFKFGIGNVNERCREL